jgi:hypothetical protein
MSLVTVGTALSDFSPGEFISSDASRTTGFAASVAAAAGVKLARPADEPDGPARKTASSFNLAANGATYAKQPAPQPQGPQPVLTAGSGLS